MNKRYLITGYNGQLGKMVSDMLMHTLNPTRDDFDLANFSDLESYFLKNDFDIVLHCAAKISPPVIDKDPNAAISDNIIATSNLAFLCNKYNKKIIYISTDYVYPGLKGNYKETDDVNPVNLYAISKLGGECAVRLVKEHLILRLSFGPDMFPYDKAWVDQFTSRETLSIISKKIVACLDIEYNGILNLGGDRVSVYQYAKNLKPDVEGISIHDASFNLPKDTSLDTTLFKNLINIKDKKL
jgi:dTDP-4-dehydrorhamnose reductase